MMADRHNGYLMIATENTKKYRERKERNKRDINGNNREIDNEREMSSFDKQYLIFKRKELF